MTTLHRIKTSMPFGAMVAIASDQALCSLEFDRPDRRGMLDSRLSRYFPDAAVSEGGNDVTKMTVRWLEGYCQGRLDGLPEIPLDARGTDFEKRVWRELRKIRPGTVMTYGQIAGKLGIPNGSRAVGGAIGRNPISVIVPCHRVVGSNGRLTGFGGGLPAKEWLLSHEGILVNRGAANVALSKNTS